MLALTPQRLARPVTLGLLILGLAAATPVLAEVPATQESGPVGSWKLTMHTPVGTRTPNLTIAPSGDGYGGSLQNREGTVELVNVNVEGKAFGFEQAMTTPMGEMTLTFQGEVDGNAMKGSVANLMGTQPFTGVRQD